MYIYIYILSFSSFQGIFQNLQGKFFLQYPSTSSGSSVCGIDQGCTNPGHHIGPATKFFTVAPKICGSSVWNLLNLLKPSGYFTYHQV
jgi:hypothetical protein